MYSNSHEMSRKILVSEFENLETMIHLHITCFPWAQGPQIMGCLIWIKANHIPNSTMQITLLLQPANRLLHISTEHECIGTHFKYRSQQ